ncbi:MAG: NYN domain-containing protein [Acidobacteriota bacterium]
MADSLKSALFVDFDNIFLGLARIDSGAAEEFASNPGRWLRWFEQPEDGHVRRRILVRQCYLNPRAFHRYRPYFTRSAFRVVDCPPLTQNGKTATDIHMVMDILDALAHDTHFDEFIILSGDSDFTPVMLRLRNHDRRSFVLAVGQASRSYTASCDRVMAEDEFIEDVLELEIDASTARPLESTMAAGGGRPIAPTASPELLDEMAESVREQALEDPNNELQAQVLPRIFRDFEEFRRDGNWLGYFSLRRLTEAIVERRRDLVLIDDDPWKVEAVGPDEEELDQLSEEIIDIVDDLVRESAKALPMAAVAQTVQGKLGDRVLDSRWAGAGSFKELLREAEEVSFSLLLIPGTPGYIWDPERHPEPSIEAPADRFDSLPEDIASIARRVNGVVGVPGLTGEEFKILFDLISEEVEENSFHLTATSKAVRDRALEKGHSIARSCVSFILKGLTYSGHHFENDKDKNDAQSLASIFADHVMTTCEDAELELTEEQKGQLRSWIHGDADAEGAEAEATTASEGAGGSS